MSKRAITEDEIDLKKTKKFRGKVRKAVFGNDLSKGFFTGGHHEWADKFSGTDMHEDALRACKEKMKLDRDQDELYAKHDLPYEESQKLSGMDRAKREEARKKDFAEHHKKTKTHGKKLAGLEEKFIDHKIKQAHQWAKDKKTAAKSEAPGVEKGMTRAERKKNLSQRVEQTVLAARHPKFPKLPEGGRAMPKKIKKSEEPDLEKGRLPWKRSPSGRATAKVSHGTYTTTQSLSHGKVTYYTPKGGKPKVIGQSANAAAAHHAKINKSDNSLDVDFDAGRMGVADYAGQTAMRVQPNAKCNGCLHYNTNLSACEIGLLPAVCGDGSYPTIGFAPAQPDRLAAKNWTNLNVDTLAPVAQAGNVEDSPVLVDIPYRIEVLGDSALALSEKMSLMKSAGVISKAGKGVINTGALMGHIWYHRMSPEKRLEAYHKHDKAAVRAKVKAYGSKKKAHAALAAGKHRPPKGWTDHMTKVLSGRTKKSFDLLSDIVHDMTEVRILPERDTDLRKSHMDIGEFADAIGTTVDVVHSIASKLGDKAKFARFIKSKLPDIATANGLDEAEIGRLYRSATRVVNSLSDTEWLGWRGVNLDATADDETIARSIAQHGLLDVNSSVFGATIRPPEPVPQLEAPEPIQRPYQDPIVTGFVGGNLHLADSLSKLN